MLLCIRVYKRENSGNVFIIRVLNLSNPIGLKRNLEIKSIQAIKVFEKGSGYDCGIKEKSLRKRLGL